MTSHGAGRNDTEASSRALHTRKASISVILQLLKRQILKMAPRGQAESELVNRHLSAVNELANSERKRISRADAEKYNQFAKIIQINKTTRRLFHRVAKWSLQAHPIDWNDVHHLNRTGRRDRIPEQDTITIALWPRYAIRRIRAESTELAKRYGLELNSEQTDEEQKLNGRLLCTFSGTCRFGSGTSILQLPGTKQETRIIRSTSIDTHTIAELDGMTSYRNRSSSKRRLNS